MLGYRDKLYLEGKKMSIKYYKDATHFLTHAGKYLEIDEARYGLVLGLAKVVATSPHRFGNDDPWFCSVNAGKEINAAALRTPPHTVVMAYFSGDIHEAAKELVEAVSGSFTTIPGITADKELGDIFADLWCKKRNTRIIYTMAERIFKLVKVNDVPMAPGRMRMATDADKELVKKWSRGFHIDCFGENSKIPEEDISKRIPEGSLSLWEAAGGPVSMAYKTRPTDKGMSVGGVYTPPYLRGKGYATSCVAELSRNILQSGKEFCTLYTDLANPTSNAIYKKIGYREVSDAVQHTFYLPEVPK